MNSFSRILSIAGLMVLTGFATVRTVDILHNNAISRNELNSQSQVIAESNQIENSVQENTTVTRTTTSSAGLATRTTQTTQNTPTSDKYSLSQIATHNSSADCWLIISNNIYNLSSFLNQHPGGAKAITQYCGKDATTAFKTHGQSGGSDHSAYAYSLLPSYFVSAVSSGVSSNPVSGNSSQANQAITKNSSFKIGDQVKISDTVVNVRNTANGTLLGTQSLGAMGVIIGGPSTSGGHTWWNVNFNNGKDGWVAGDYIQLVSNSLVTQPTNPLDNQPTNPLDNQPVTDTTAPSTPSNLSATAISSSQISLSWSASTDAVGVTGYKIYRNSVLITTNTATSYTDSGLSASTLYSYNVAAIDAAGNTSSQSSSASATTQAQSQTPPASGYTTAQVATHNSQSNCWIIISAKVYNVTNFITSHPGGANAIISRCGTDVTTVFNTNGGGGHNHSASARALLPTYYVGDVVSTPTTYSLSVSKSGTGSGTVSGSGISCGSTCSASINSGTSVTLTATPASGSTFSGWSGACSGTSSCTVTMNANQNVNAIFDVSGTLPPTTYTLSVVSSNGTVTSNPAGISCGSTCSTSYTQGTSVVLTATPNSGYTFSGWTGACSGTGSCTVTMNANTNLTANYTANGGSGGPTTYTINVTSAGNYDVLNLTINSGDSIKFVYTPPIGNEVITVFTPAGISSLTLDGEFTQRTKTFSTTGTWTFKAKDHNGNQGTLIVQ